MPFFHDMFKETINTCRPHRVQTEKNARYLFFSCIISTYANLYIETAANTIDYNYFSFKYIFSLSFFNFKENPWPSNNAKKIVNIMVYVSLLSFTNRINKHFAIFSRKTKKNIEIRIKTTENKIFASDFNWMGSNSYCLYANILESWKTNDGNMEAPTTPFATPKSVWIT